MPVRRAADPLNVQYAVLVLFTGPVIGSLERGERTASGFIHLYN